jgi:hypothetical protein
MERKNYFSDQSKAYAAFRPAYPEKLYQFILSHVTNRLCAWDCGTGNGQVARQLAGHFRKVYATDVSQQQIDEAFPANNIFYSVCPAERTPFQENQFDLVTVAQALHWFDRDQFYEEVRRTAKPHALLAAWGYALLSIDPVVDQFFIRFYTDTTGPYWDPARRLVENQYRDLFFPFPEIPCPDFTIRVTWSLDQFAGYLSSWSATQQFIRVHGRDPVPEFKETLRSLWPADEVKQVTFPVFMKLGKVPPR